MLRKLLPICALLIVCAGCSQENPRLLPRQLAGMWTTDEPRYKDRFLELYTTYVIIGAGPSQPPQVQVIDSVKREPAGNEDAYTIESSDLDGTEHVMTLQFNPDHGGEIRFKNQKNIVWRRHTDGPSQSH